MELVVDSAQRELAEKTQALPVIKRNRLVTKALLGVAATLLGFLAYRLVWLNPNQLLQDDLPVIHQLFIYSQFEEVEFLHMLHERVQGNWPLAQEQLIDQHQQVQLIADSGNRKQWLASLSDNERVTLRASYNRYRSLSETERDRLRNLQQEITLSSKREELEQTLIQYENWLQTLPVSEQYALRELSSAERARHVARLIKQIQNDHFIPLSPKELKEFWGKVEPQIKRKVRQTFEQLPEPLQRRFNRHKNNVDIIDVLKIWKLRQDPEEMAEKFGPIVLEALPEHARKPFEDLSAPEKLQQLMKWRGEFMEQVGQVTQQELEDYFVEDLDEQERQRLLAMPHDQMQRELQDSYLGKTTIKDQRRPPGRGRPPGPEFGPPPPLREEFRNRFFGEDGNRPRPPRGRAPGGRRPPPPRDDRPGPPPPRQEDGV